MQASLQITSGAGVGARTELPIGRPLLLGRLPECDMRFLDDRTISRRHCQIHLTANGCTLTNLSSNGTLVNGDRVEETELNDGDEIWISRKTQLRVFLPDLDQVGQKQHHGLPNSTFDELRRTVPRLPELGDGTFQTEPMRGESVLQMETAHAPCELVVVCGPAAGKVVEIPEGVVFRVGRLATCDLPIANDPVLSRDQCHFTFIPPHCYFANLSTNGSFVNGERVDGERQVSDGDEIEIGSNTILRVHLQSVPAQSVFDGDAAVAVADELVTLTRHDVAGGFVRFNFSAEARRVAMLAAFFGRSRDVRAILDAGKAGVDVPDDCIPPCYLVDWLDPEAVKQVSPLVIAPGDTREFVSIIEEAYGTDACVITFSKPDAERFEETLRRLARFNPATGDIGPNQAFFGYWWPTILRSILSAGDAMTPKHMMNSVDGFLFEDVTGEGWQLFATADFANNVNELPQIEVTTASD